MGETKMDKYELEDVANIDEPTRQQEIGLLSGLIDGMFVCVNHRGFLVNRTGNGSIELSRDGEVLGGRYYVTENNFAGLIEWLNAKVALYGETE
jgi:hypothetical protein